MLKRTKMVEKRKLFWCQKDEFNLRISCFSRAKYARLLHSWTSVSAMFQITHFFMDFSHILPGLNLQTTHRTIYFWDGQTFNVLLWGIHFQFSQTNKQVNQINKVNFCIFLNFIWCYIWKHWEKACFFHAENARTQKMLIEFGLPFWNLLVTKSPIAGDTFLF